MILIRKICFLILVLATSLNYSYSQFFKPLTAEEEKQIATYLELAQAYESSNEYQNASNQMNKVAFIYWQNGYLDDAVETFLSSAELIKRISNLEYLKSIYSNIGVLYTDQEELERALSYFELSLKVRRDIGNGEGIAAGLIDVAYILSVLNQAQDALKFLHEALVIATEINSSKLILNCYQMLSSNYEDVGNLKMSSEYASKYTSYEVFVNEQSLKDEFGQKEIENLAEIKTSKAETEAAVLARQLQELRALAAQDSLNVQIKAKQDSLLAAEEEARQRRLEIDYLNTQQELADSQLKQQQAEQQRQQIVIYAGIGILILVLVLAFVMFRSYRQQQAANKKLGEQNLEIASSC